MLLKSLQFATALLGTALACDDEIDSRAHPHAHAHRNENGTLAHHHTPRNMPSHQALRYVRRMQPGALDATMEPARELEWGQLNFIHTTDTHGWLQGHLRERNYGADWGDFVSFTHHMRKKADELGVDLLIVDTGDLHHGTGLDEPPGRKNVEGEMINELFSKMDFDLLTIGNHELYSIREARLTVDFAAHYNAKEGDERYITTNAQYRDKKYEHETWDDKKWEESGKFFGVPYRYFTTKHGLRIMALGVIFDDKTTLRRKDFRVIFADKLVKTDTFIRAVEYEEEVDLFLVLGHNEVDVTRAHSKSTFLTIFDAIRQKRPNVPIQFLGGHTHSRDFRVFDDKTTGMQSGRYCETVGWLSISGVNKKLVGKPEGIKHPTTKAVPKGTMEKRQPSQSESDLDLRYARRYIDWNRKSFAFHAPKSQDAPSFHDTPYGLAISEKITETRKDYGLTKVLGCAPQDYCQFCAKYGSKDSIYTLSHKAINTIVIDVKRKKVPRVFIDNVWLLRFEIFKGIFTVEDAIAASPLDTHFVYIQDVPYEIAMKIVLPHEKQKRDGTEIEVHPEHRHLVTRDFDFSPMTVSLDECSVDPPPSPIMAANKTDQRPEQVAARHIKREAHLPGPYTTTVDDFGNDGDDTPHERPFTHHFTPQGHSLTLNMPEDGSKPDTVDVVTQTWTTVHVIKRLNELQPGHSWTQESFKTYAEGLSMNNYLMKYAEKNWQGEDFDPNKPICPAGAD